MGGSFGSKNYKGVGVTRLSQNIISPIRHRGTKNHSERVEGSIGHGDDTDGFLLTALLGVFV